MKVGILTYHRAVNFGANLQLLSTYHYLQGHGYEPVIIDYCPEDFEASYALFPAEQAAMHAGVLSGLSMTGRCGNAREVAAEIERHGLERVIIGSDAVAQHHPWLARVHFPSSRIVSFPRYSSDRMFPNPFWGEFLDYVGGGVRVAAMSTSSQQSRFGLFGARTRERMWHYLEQFVYVSARDEWTRDMYRHVSGGRLEVPVTPDPVFALNENVPGLPTEEETRARLGLERGYVVFGVQRCRTVNERWVRGLERECRARGLECVGLPFPQGLPAMVSLERRVELPLSPIDWYSIIRYSEGFVGHNMHSVVSALHNGVPCYSFDQYGIRVLGQWVNDRSSKVYDILARAGFADNRSASGLVWDVTPRPAVVLERLLAMDRGRCRAFAEGYYREYVGMMEEIGAAFG